MSDIEKKRHMRKIALASLLGATIEWYDFFLYGVVAGIVFNKLFFPATMESYTATILAYITFAIGYLARPFGAIIFGHFGDKIGRKTMLVITLTIMGVATVAIGFIPTYATIGIAAPIILQLCRLAQGFGLGGEWGGAVLLAYEHADEKERSFYAAFPQIGLATGLMFSAGIVALLSSQLSNEDFMAWGWRIAFIISTILIVIALYIRMNILETPDFVKAKEEREKNLKKISLPLATVLKEYPSSILLGIGARWIDGTFYNVFAVFSITYLTQTMGMNRTEVLLGVTYSAIFMIPFMLLYGRLADKFGKGRVFGTIALMCCLLTWPAFWLMQNSGGQLLPVYVALMIPLGCLYAGIFATMAPLFSEAFAPEVRYTGISFIYQVPSFLVAGIVPGLCTYFLKINDGNPFYIILYTMFVAVVAACSAFGLQYKANKRKSLKKTI